MFRSLLKERGITQSELAIQVGKSQRLISKWVNGDCQPQINMLPKLAEVLNVSVETILECFK